jgi:hypothetical protein
MNPSAIAETMQGETIMDAIFGESQNATITGSVVIKESDNYYNRMLFVFQLSHSTYYLRQGYLHKSSISKAPFIY